MIHAVLVNGVPASGKSTVARGIGERLGVPVLSLDAVKEALFDELGDRDADREWGRVLGRASIQSIWHLLPGFPPGATVVIEAWFRLPPHDVVRQGLERARVERWVEIWCHADPETLVARNAARARHRGHPPAAGYAAELRQLAGIATPMALAPWMDVDTTPPSVVDLDAIARWVQEQLQPGGSHRVGPG